MATSKDPARDAPVVRSRRALSHVGGKVDVSTRDAELEETLRAALEVQADESRVQAHVHGFHSYPARLHPETAKRLISDLSRPRDTVLDPFCGSGTVVVEARGLGRRALGSDLNPLAVELTRLKAGGASEPFVRAMLTAAERVVAHATARKQAELGPTEPYGPEDRAMFAPHVLLELDGLRHGIEQLPDREVAWTLGLVHSALLTKVSLRAGDSSGRQQPKRISGGFTIRFFLAKTRELGERLRQFSELVPPGTPAPRVQVSDARELSFVRDGVVALLVSSPPYPGVYDYYEHHRARLRWLRISAGRFARDEIGARRSRELGAARAAQDWKSDFTQCLKEMSRVLQPGGRAAIVVADSVLAGRPLVAAEWLPPLCQRAGCVLLGHASQQRPYFHQPTERAFSALPRREHLFVVGKPRHDQPTQSTRR